MSNRSKTLYIGVTSQIMTRVRQHKNGRFEGFASRYKLNRLVYCEEFSNIGAAITREKQLKGWTRIKKIALIVAENPEWQDLAEDWDEPIPLFKPPK